MDLELTGKTALITGAGQGVGRAIARVLAEEGVRVAVNDYYLDRAASVVSEIEKAGGSALCAQADITDLDQVQSMIKAIASTYGDVDILVNNAGVPVDVRSGKVARTLFAGSSPSYWKMQIDLNLYGCLNCTHSVLEAMIERKNGKIISIVSEAARIGEVNMAVYSGAKAGVLGFSKALAREVGRHRINVNCIAIGATAHEGNKDRLDPDADPRSDERLNKFLKLYPIGRGLGRLGRAHDPAHAVAFLASDKAMYITGQCLSVSGGFTMVG